MTKIVICRQLGGVGDVLMMSAVYRGLKEKYPKSKITLVTSSLYLAGALIDIAEHNPFIDDIVVIEPYHATTRTTKKAWTQFASTPDLEDEYIWTHADLAVDLNTACIEYEQPAMRGTLPMIPRYKIWANAAGVSPSTYTPAYNIKKEELAWAKDYAKRWKGKTNIALGTTACDPKRGIGIGKLTEICQRLISKGFNPITVDATFHFEGVDYIIGKRIREVIALLTQMDAVISVDSGVLHMAGVAQQVATVPIIGIFGSTDYRMRMGPYYGSAIDSSKLVECAPCWYQFHCLRSPNPGEHLKCLERSSPDFIVEETCRWLAKVGKFSMV